MQAISKTKQYKCKQCAQPFVKERLAQKVCGTDCAVLLIAQLSGKKAKKAAAKTKRETREKLASMAGKPELTAIAQKAFNAYIRARDAGKPCICCGEPLSLKSGATHGGSYDCGHYLSVGARPHLRFHEDNAHGQRKYCNTHKAGNASGYRVGLIARIGMARVEALECDNTPRKYTHDQLRELSDFYRNELKKLVKP